MKASMHEHLERTTPDRATFFQGLRKTLRLLGEFVGKRPPTPVAYEWFTDPEVAGLDEALEIGGNARIDDATWRDLEVKRYLRFVASTSSILGRQSLFHELRRGASGGVRGAGSKLRHILERSDLSIIDATRSERFRLRCIDTDLTDLLREGIFELPEWATRLRSLPYISSAAAVLLFTSAWPIATAVLAICILFSGYVHLKFFGLVSKWQRQRVALMSVLQCGLSLARLQRSEPSLLLEEILKQEDSLKSLWSEFSSGWVARVPGMAEYLNLIALHDYVKFHRQTELLTKRREVIKDAYLAIASFEANICLLEHLRSLRLFCWASWTDGKSLELIDAVNPLLATATPLSIDVRNSGAFISAQNGAGKSTFLRAIGLNILSARAFGFCYARSAVLPSYPVYASIQNEDSLSTGVSLYMAELTRAEELARLAGESNRAVFLLDEVFRGTNNIESTAAAAALLSFLAKRCLVFVSSHNLVLAPLLNQYLTPWRIVSDSGDIGDLRLERGVLVETNGVDLMKLYAFSPEILGNATKVLTWFSEYVTHPEQFPEI